MIKEYRAYCACPNLATAKPLLEALLASSEPAPPEAFTIWLNRRLSGNSHTLKTSGSTTGTPRTYKFGPLWSFWLQALEKATKFPDHNKYTLISNRYLTRQTCTDSIMVEPTTKELFINTFISVSHFDDRLVKLFCEELDRLPPAVLLADPNVWLYLTTHPVSKEYFTLNPTKFIITSTNWEAFYKQHDLRAAGVLINDTMINWENGFNFYTCRFGSKHSFPFFLQHGSRVINLVNLCETAGTDDDSLVYGGYCACGKRQVIFTPHKAVQPNLVNVDDLAEELESLFNNFQIVQAETTKICYDGEMSDRDRDRLLRISDNVEFWPHMSLMITTKFPVFYKNIARLQLKPTIARMPFRHQFML
jgi:hypothetical protein